MKAKYLLQIGLAFVLIYAGVDAFLHPFDWIGYVPHWVQFFHLSRAQFLHLHSAAEIILGILLLANYKLRIAAFLVFLDLLAIVIFGGFSRAVFLTTFRDIGLLFMAVALVLIS